MLLWTERNKMVLKCVVPLMEPRPNRSPFSPFLYVSDNPNIQCRYEPDVLDVKAVILPIILRY